MYIMCIYMNESCTNVVKKHVHMVVVNGAKNVFASKTGRKIEKQVFFFMACHEKNIVHNSMI